MLGNRIIIAMGSCAIAEGLDSGLAWNKMNIVSMETKLSSKGSPAQDV